MKESDIQKAIVQYLELMGVYFFSINNEMAGWGKKAMHRTMHFKAMGLRAGASDLAIVLNKKVVFLEIKTPKGRLSENQKTFKTAVEDLGHLYKVARSVQDVERLLLSLR